MRHPLEFLMPPEIGVELIYSFVIIICSLMIYWSTREIYELSSYKGLKYFRKSFLFFAIAYFFRYFIMFFLVILNLKEFIEFRPDSILWIPLFIFIYSSSIAVFYLLYSVKWKKLNSTIFKMPFFHILAILIAFIGVFSRSHEIQFILNIILLFFVSFVLLTAYRDSKDKKKGKSLLLIYFLLFVFWILNVIDIIIPKFLELFKLFIYLASILLFMSILYKVLRKIGG